MIIQPTPASEFRFRITLIRRGTGNTNELNEVVADNGPTRTVWAAIKPLMGKQLTVAGEVFEDVSHEVRIRYIHDARYCDSFQHDNTIYNIESIIDVGNQHVEQLLVCHQEV